MMMMKPCVEVEMMERVHQRLIAQHYGARSNRTMEEREKSPIVGLKKLHAWVKKELFTMYANEGDAVLDLACGKASDLAAWLQLRVATYVGLDLVKSSLDEASRRFNHHLHKAHDNLSVSQNHLVNTLDNPYIRFLCCDCFSSDMPLHVYLDTNMFPGSFDICSCQFALHYSWSSEQRAHATLQNISLLLRPGGLFIGTIPDSDIILSCLSQSHSTSFGNSIFSIKFQPLHFTQALRSSKEPFGIQYEFHLDDAVDHCPEWLVPFDGLVNLAHKYGLELVLKKNFHEFVNDRKKEHDLTRLMSKLGSPRSLSTDEWNCASIYLVFVFRKKYFDW